MAKQIERKPLLEREYVVPLRREWLKVQEYKRATKAVKTLRKFIAKHMKLYDSDLRKVKIDPVLNNELRFRGIKKPPAKIKVRAIKYVDYIEVKLVDIPKKIEFELLRKERKKSELEKTKKQIKKSKEDSPTETDSTNDSKEKTDVKDSKEKEDLNLKQKDDSLKQDSKMIKDNKAVNVAKEKNIQKKIPKKVTS